MKKIEKIDLSEVNEQLTIPENDDFDKRLTAYNGQHFNTLAQFYTNSSLQSHEDHQRFPLDLISYEPEGVIHIYFDEEGICIDTLFFSCKDLEKPNN